MRRFEVILRLKNLETIIGLGVEFEPGEVVSMYWPDSKTTSNYRNMTVMQAIHCSNNTSFYGQTVKWIDDERTPIQEPYFE